MKKIKTTKIQDFYKYFSISISSLIVMLFIWFRFLRERLPKDIPFNLSIIYFIILVFICIIYVIILIRIKYPKESTSYLMNKEIFLRFIQNFYNMLDELDTFIKKNKYITQLLCYFITKTISKCKLYNTQNNIRFYVLFNVIPKIILLLFFTFDIFYFKKLEIFYYVLILGLIPLIYSYCIYSAKKLLELLLHNLEKNYYVKILSTTEDETIGNGFVAPLSNLQYNDYGVLATHYFVEVQSWNLIFDYDLYKYTCIETGEAREDYARLHNITLPKLRVFEPNYDYISKELSKNFFEKIEHVVNLQAFMETHKDITVEHLEQKYKHKFYLLLSYFICWLYILIVSIHTLNLQDVLEIIKTMPQIEDSFSGINFLISTSNYPWFNIFSFALNTKGFKLIIIIILGYSIKILKR